MKHEITRADILPISVYEKERKERRKRMAETKARRRIEVGPFATFCFESYATMLHQVHEMLAIEKGGDEQVQSELAAYNPLIPQGRDLVATLMFEIEDPARRARELARLGGVERQIYMVAGGARIHAKQIGDDERTRADGKTSAVHFLRFDFPPAAIAVFRKPGAEVVLEIAHPNYAHMARMPEPVRAALAGDFD
jgi:predicted acylesterase/phospholipase RssA